jgi:uncharacterized membrane protein
MSYLVLGLILFLGVHSVRIVADDWRTQIRQRIGANVYKAVYSMLSIIGFSMIVWGFGIARETPVMLWMPGKGLRHAASLFTVIAFILLVATYVPRNAIKARFHHPMVLAVKFWALGHLLANGSVTHVLLFGAFLAWAVVAFVVSRKRDKAQNSHYAPGNTVGTTITVVAGIGAWALFAFVLHGLLMGVRPFG